MDDLLLLSPAAAFAASASGWRGVNPHLFTIATTALVVGVLPVIDRLQERSPLLCGEARVSVAVAGLAMCHAMAALVSAARGRPWPTWVFAMVLAANQPLLMAGTGAYIYGCGGSSALDFLDYDRIVEPQYAVPTFAIWLAVSVGLCFLIDVSAVWFWRAKDMAFIVLEFFSVSTPGARSK